MLRAPSKYLARSRERRRAASRPVGEGAANRDTGENRRYLSSSCVILERSEESRSRAGKGNALKGITEFGPSPAPEARPLPDRERLGSEPFMARKNREIPPVHPGEILSEEFLKPLGLSMNQLALALRVPGNRINAIVAGQRGITADMALRLGRYFGTSPQFWINMQGRYDLESAKDELADRIEREVQPRKRAA